MTSNIQTSVQLYRYILRCIRKFPEDRQFYYRHQLRQMYKSHSDETDPDRIKQIIGRAISDTEWLVDKYAKK